jgi:glycosyltransferase involved in cell wall biosynthesis
MSKISVAIIARNEEKQIRECLESVKWADEIIVLDDESSDNTVKIAKEYTDKVFKRKLDIEGRHRNFAYSKATHEWVLSIDCDERVTPELADEIRSTLASNPQHNAFSIPIKAFMGKHWIRYAGYYPARKLRLFKKDKFKYEEAKVHPRAILEGTCGQLNGDIVHYSYQNFFDVINKLNRDTNLEAEKWITDGRKVKGWQIFRKFFDRFFKFYIGKKGYKDGVLGIMFSFFHSLYQILAYAKYWEMKQEEKRT